jgi:hypothetical protein
MGQWGILKLGGNQALAPLLFRSRGNSAAFMRACAASAGRGRADSGSSEDRS